MSRFKGVFDARQNIAEEPDELKPEKKARNTKTKTPAEPALPPLQNLISDRPKLGRPPGKRSNPEYQSVTTFLHRETYLSVQRVLLGGDQDFGDVVDELLKTWLNQRE